MNDMVHVRATGGVHRFGLAERVIWAGLEGQVIALTTEPSVTVELDNGRRLLIGQSHLKRARVKTDED